MITNIRCLVVGLGSCVNAQELAEVGTKSHPQCDTLLGVPPLCCDLESRPQRAIIMTVSDFGHRLKAGPSYQERSPA
jgi:hypothetical protein